MIIDYCTIHDSNQVSTWSGLNFFIRRALESFAGEVNLISGMRTSHTTMLKVRYRLSRLQGKNFYFDLTDDFVRQYAAELLTRLSGNNSVIFTVNSQLLSCLNVPNKVVLYNDATIGNLYGYYDYFSNLTWYDKREVFRNEYRALHRADLLLFASKWAAESAIHEFGVPAEKVHVVPFGANLPDVPSTTEIENLVQSRSFETVRLLFIGYDFNRKGGDKAVETVVRLNESGIKAMLTMVGISNFDDYHFPPCVENGGVLHKDNPNDLKELDTLFKRSHFFIMPSTRECYGLVFAEAFAYGLPVLAINTGGVSTIVDEQINGWLFSLETPAQSFCSVITDMVNADTEYREMALRCRRKFDEELNWNAAAKKIEALINKLV